MHECGRLFSCLRYAHFSLFQTFCGEAFQVSFVAVPDMTFLSSTFSIFIALVAATHAVSGTPTTSPQISRRVLHESRDNVPHGWGLRRRADADTVLPLKISLRQSNLANLDAYLLDIADPDSPRYGQHWTPARVADTFRPSTAAVDAVREWLASADSGLVDAYSPDAAFSRVQLSADGAHRHHAA